MTFDAPLEGADDLVLPFAVEPLDVRGRVVRLGPSIDTHPRRHGYPDAVARRARRGGGADRAPRLVAEIRGPLPAPDQDRRRRSR